LRTLEESAPRSSPDLIDDIPNGAEPIHPSSTIQVWDVPLRIFHWSLLLAIAAAYVTAEFGGSDWAQWHGRIGAFVMSLIVFRVVWGFVGTTHARFVNFVPTPARLIAYWRGRWTGQGHSPLGALAVIALLLLVAAQIGTGVFSNDDVAFSGPLADRIGKDRSDALTGWHVDIFYVLVGMIALHVSAIAFYWLGRGANLVRPMITGRKEGHTNAAGAAPERLWLRFAFAVTLAVVSTWLVFRDSAPTVSDSTQQPVSPADW
jgi:cytochrome b